MSGPIFLRFATIAAMAVLFRQSALAQPAAPQPAAPPTTAQAGWRIVDPENTLILTTTKGVIVIEMAPAAAPSTVAHLKSLVRAGFYDNSQWYRVVAGFVAQTGDRGQRRYSSGRPPIAAEFIFPTGAMPPPPPPLEDPTAGSPPRFLGSLPVARSTSARPGQAWAAFCPGVAGLAHHDDPNSGESQIFFLQVHADNLESTFTAWGRVLVGMEVLPLLAPGEPPANPDRVITARIAADLPPAERPTLEVIDTQGPVFARQLRDLVRRNNFQPRPCDVTLQARLRPPGA